MRIKTCCKQRRTSGRLGGGVFFVLKPLADQKSISQTYQRHMMMPALPTAPCVVIQSQFLFQLLIVLLDSPAQFRQLHQGPPRDVRGQVGEPIVAGCCSFLRPLDQHPEGLGLPSVTQGTVRRLHSAGRKTALLYSSACLPPTDGVPVGRRPSPRQLLHRLRPLRVVSPPRTADLLTSARLHLAGWSQPSRGRRPPPYHIAQPAGRQSLPKFGVVPVSHIRQNRLRFQPPAQKLIDQLQNQFGLGAEGGPFRNPHLAAASRP